MALKAQQKQQALQVAAALAGSRQVGHTSGLLLTEEEGALYCHQAMRLVLSMETVENLADEHPELLTARLSDARPLLQKLIAEVEAERAVDRREREIEEARKALVAKFTEELAESNLEEADLAVKVTHLVDEQLAVQFPETGA